MENLEVSIKSTLLSQKPREESLLIALLSVMVLLFVSLFCWRNPSLLNLLAASRHQVVGEQEYWRLLTTIAIHADLTHFLSNAILFAFFTFLLYGYFGFWLFPVAVAALGSLTNYLSLLTYPENIQLIGASGLVYLMAGFWLTAYVLVERSHPLKRRVLVALGIALIVLVPSNLSPQVSYRTHAIGCGIGIIVALGYFQARKEQIRSLETFQIEEVDE
jgi:rhomboid protease GluP